MAELGRELKQEKQKRKELDSKFSQIQEEFADMKSTNETLQKVWRFKWFCCNRYFSALFVNLFFNIHKCIKRIIIYNNE